MVTNNTRSLAANASSRYTVLMPFAPENSIVFHLISDVLVNKLTNVDFVPIQTDDEFQQFFKSVPWLENRRIPTRHYLLLIYPDENKLFYGKNIFVIKKKGVQKIAKTKEFKKVTYGDLKNIFVKIFSENSAEQSMGRVHLMLRKYLYFESRDEQVLYENFLSLVDFMNESLSRATSDILNDLFGLKTFRSRVLNVGLVSYEIINPRYNSKNILSNDYLQLYRRDVDRSFFLRTNSCFHAGLKYRYPFSFMDHIGSLIAQKLGFNVQISTLVKIGDSICQISEDFRGDPSCLSMECIAREFPAYSDKENDIQVVADLIERLCHKRYDSLLLKIYCLDVLLLNSSRTIRKLQYIRLKNNNDPIIDLLIENILGHDEYLCVQNNNQISFKKISLFVKNYKLEEVFHDFYSEVNNLSYDFLREISLLPMTFLNSSMEVITKGKAALAELKFEIERSDC